MEPLIRQDIILDKDFIHQIKWDGIRGLSQIRNNNIAIYTKKGLNCTDSYPELFQLPEQLKASQAILDGELVVFNDEGIPSFYRSLKRNRTKNPLHVQGLLHDYPVKYILFDLLELNNENLRNKTLTERQKILRNCFQPSATAVITDNFLDGSSLLELIKEKGMEGIVSKRASSPYIPGKVHTDWFKIKIKKKILCVIMGIKLKNNILASLSLGIYEDKTLVHIGHVSSGLTQKDLKILNESVLSNQAIAKEIHNDRIDLEPLLTCWVLFSEWTDKGTLRHPVFIGFSHDPVLKASGREIVYE